MEAKIVERAKNEGGGYGSRGDSCKDNRRWVGREAGLCPMWLMDPRGEELQKTQPWGLAVQTFLRCIIECKVTSAKRAQNGTRALLNSMAKVPSASAAPAFHALLLLLLWAVPAAAGSAGTQKGPTLPRRRFAGWLLAADCAIILRVSAFSTHLCRWQPRGSSVGHCHLSYCRFLNYN